jgi:hypothetical protein
MSAADYYRQAPEVLRGDQARNEQIAKLVEQKLERWQALETKAKSAQT